MGGDCEQFTAPKASFECHARNFSRLHVAQVLEPSFGQDLRIVVLANLKSHSISSMFHRNLLNLQLSPHFSTLFLAFALFRCYFLPRAHPLPLCNAKSVMLCPFGRTASLTDSEPKTLIEVSEHTPINLLSRKGSFDSDLNDPATTVDASETIDTTEGTVDFTTFLRSVK